MDASYFRMLFDYNRWANARILDRAVTVHEADYFAPRPGLSFGSLHATLVHLLGGEIRWLARWRGEPPRPRLSEADAPTFATLRERWRQVEADQRQFVDRVTDSDVTRPLVYGIGERQFTHPLAYLMGHVVNHGTQFRSEAAVALTQVGLSPGDLDVSVFIRDYAPHDS